MQHFLLQLWNIFEYVLRVIIVNNYKLLIIFPQSDVYLNEPIKIDKLIKLANQSINSIFTKRHIKGEKHIAQENLRKSDVSENRKVCYGRFLRNGFHRTYRYISKSSWVQDLEKSANQSFLNERWNWMIKAFAGVCLSMSIRLLRPCFNKGKASSPCYNFLLYLFHKIWMIIKVIWPVNYVLSLKPWNPYPFQKESFYLWCLSGVDYHCSLSSLYSTCNRNTCNPLSRFHQNTSPCTNSWLLK